MRQTVNNRYIVFTLQTTAAPQQQQQQQPAQQQQIIHIQNTQQQQQQQQQQSPTGSVQIIQQIVGPDGQVQQIPVSCCFYLFVLFIVLMFPS